jgi:hypothetical protein
MFETETLLIALAVGPALIMVTVKVYHDIVIPMIGTLMRRHCSSCWCCWSRQSRLQCQRSSDHNGAGRFSSVQGKGFCLQAIGDRGNGRRDILCPTRPAR